MGKILIKDLINERFMTEKALGSLIIHFYSSRGWSLTSISKLIKKLDTNESTKRVRGSKGPHTMHTPANIQRVTKLISRHKNELKTHKSSREIERVIERNIDILHSTV